MLLCDSFCSSAWVSSGSLSTEGLKPAWRSSDSKLALPCWMFSSRRSRLNHCLILMRELLDWHSDSQSRLGPLAVFEVSTSTMSPFCSRVSKPTMRELTLAPTMRLPTSEWMA